MMSRQETKLLRARKPRPSSAPAARLSALAVAVLLTGSGCAEFLATVGQGSAGLGGSTTASAEGPGVVPVTVPQQTDVWFQAGAERLLRAKRVAGRAERAHNVILFIGDGMDVATVTAARILAGQLRGQSGEENELAWEAFPHVALVKTYNTNQQVGDSAGTATALLTGVKTQAGVLGMTSSARRGDCATSKGHEAQTLVELAEDAGLATGIVTTTRLTHATVAAAYAHLPERDWESDVDLDWRANSAGCKDIARQFVEFDFGDGIDVALGGGRKHFTSRSSSPQAATSVPGRRDGADLSLEWLERHQNAQVVFDGAAFAGIDAGSTDHLLGLFGASHMSYEIDRRSNPTTEPSLTEMTVKAVEILSKNPRGFLLLVEAGRIDHGHHMGNAFRALTETIELSNAVSAARALTDPAETLVIVTADHGHTMTIAGYPTRGNPILGKVQGNSTDGQPMRGPALAADGKPFTTLAYTNGPGATHGLRTNLSSVNTEDPDFKQPALYPLAKEIEHGYWVNVETHGGQDVALWARGPGARLFQGTIEQNVVFHVIEDALALRKRVSLQRHAEKPPARAEASEPQPESAPARPSPIRPIGGLR